jgi:hypothetical protein
VHVKEGQVTYTQQACVQSDDPALDAVGPVALTPAANVLEVRISGPWADGPDEFLFDDIDEACGRESG